MAAMKGFGLLLALLGVVATSPPPAELVVELRAAGPDVAFGRSALKAEQGVEVAVGPAEGDPLIRGATLSSSPGPSELVGRLRVPIGDLCADRPCVVRLRSPSWWAAERTLAPIAGGAPRLVLDVFPTGFLSWNLPEERDQPLPTEVSVRFAPQPKNDEGILHRGGSGGAEREGPSGTVPCRIVERLVTCGVPAGVLDLVVQSPGRVPSHLWGVEIEPGATVRLGRLVLVPGARVSGTVLSEQTREPIEAARVVIEPARVLLDRNPVSKKRFTLRRREVRTDAKGRFVVEGVAPGGYRIVVESEGYAPGVREPIEVQSAPEVSLDEPVLLGTYGTLELFLTPPIDPYGQPWRVDLARLEEGRSFSGVHDVPKDSGDDGFWSAEDLVPGTYMLRVGTGLDPSWYSQEVQVDSGRATLQVDLPAVLVEGKLTLAGEPLSATLWFGGRHGERSIRMDADSHGEFQAYLPEEGEWPVDIARHGVQGVQAVEPVDVEQAPGRRVAHVRIELPETTLHGRVVDAEGGPQPDASVVVLQPSRQRRAAALRVDGDGRFVLEGLAEGDYVVQAEGPGGTSPWVAVELDEGLVPPELVLRIDAMAEVLGRVVSPSGVVPGATVTVVPAFSGGLPVTPVTVTAGMDGRFRAELPRSVEQVSVLVFPPGFAATIFSHRFDPGDRRLEILVQTTPGTLHLTLPPPRVEGAPPSALLLHRGAAVGIEALIDWIRAEGVGSGSPGRMTVPAMEPGDYRLCSREILAPASAGLRGGCTAGYLAPGGELTLDLGEGAESGGR